MSDIRLFITNGSAEYEAVCAGDISWETERKGTPGKLEFTVIKDDVLDFEEGNQVRLQIDNQGVFFGFVFTKKRSGAKPEEIQVTAYDQLRYFKNKDTCVYKNQTADEFLAMLAKDYELVTGILEPTGYKIASRVEDNKTLFDMVQSALDLTIQGSGKMFVLYDDFGKLSLKNIESMRLPVSIKEDTAQDFDYSSSIDSNTYNRIKLCYENKDTKKRDVYVAKDSSHINDWGILQMYQSLDNAANGKAKAEELLALYNQKSRSLSVKKAIGDIRVRGGCGVAVDLELGDVKVNTYMIVEKARHIMTGETHFMDLTLRGGGFNV